MSEKNKKVSFETDQLILVDDNDNELGFKIKSDCHSGHGILHRAFSVFIINGRRELLIQRRSNRKRLWPMFWSNSCCSHPRKGENNKHAAERRLREELGLDCDLKFLYKFKYHASFEDMGSEFELCSVFIGKSEKIPSVNETEISEWKYIPVDELHKKMFENPELFSPWFIMEWEKIRREHKLDIDKLFVSTQQLST